MTTTTTGEGAGLRRVTGWLLVAGAVAFAVAATVLSSTFAWPDILREPPQVVLPAFLAGGTSLVWTWFIVAWTYGILLVPILLAESYVAGDPSTQAAVAAAWTAQHQFGGALLGEHLGQLLAIAWSITISLVVLHTGMLARWVGWAGLVASGLYLTGQGDILATAVPSFPVWDLGGLLGSTLWGLWVLALGVAVLRAPIRHPTTDPGVTSPTSAAASG